MFRMVKRKSGVINMIDFDDLIRLDNSDINELPNEIVRNNYNLFKTKLKERNLEPHRVNLIGYVGGVCFQFNKKANCPISSVNNFSGPKGKKTIKDTD